ncbi:hypothetical protein BDF20DRAFT_347836 [Mycotypha africana]|uniref:uncharacterized protein n=1 Tax=Mycotypha africana TaxID=64632 RepID=UPI0023010FD2|nr:uncharacterized protein BDF20DRAFT_347836 [Mycotypha africana]KAI8967023.1 hypothetical protein BDF20DRAFT_347836 [Mycotypha africana]
MPPFQEEIYQSGTTPVAYLQPVQQGNGQKKKVFHRLYSHPTTELSRTQCKLQLQRLSYLTNDKDYLDHPQNMRRLTKELDRIDKEYRNVRRFEDPMRASLKRLTKSENASCLFNSTASNQSYTRSSSKRNSISSLGSSDGSSVSSTTNHSTSCNTELSTSSGINWIDFNNNRKKPLQSYYYLSSSADGEVTANHSSGNFLRRWFNHVLEDTFIHSSHQQRQQYSQSFDNSVGPFSNANFMAYSHHPTIVNRLKRRPLASKK